MVLLRRLILIPTLAFAFGFVVATLKGQGAGVLDGIGNLSAPWLLVAFLPGLQSRSMIKGAAVGLAATLLALTGFYLAAVLHADHNLRAGLELAFTANRRYFAAGLVSGPLCGAVGSWWKSRGTRATPLVGLLLLAEPIVILFVGLVPSLSRFGSGWQSQSAVYLAEFCAGAAVLVAARFLPRGRVAGRVP